MPRELDVAGVLFPSLLVALLVAIALYLALDWGLARTRLYRWVWHVHLFRLALFVIIFSALGCCLYR